MEHESFENEEVAKVMNANFVNIKVDREERPDLDLIYQPVAQLITKGGGWPLTVFLTLNSGSISGTISDNNWLAVLYADRTVAGGVTEPPPVPGRYKLVFPGDEDAARGPHGFTFATATMDAAGRISVVATLADGTVFSQGTTLSLRRRWPLFGRLYGGGGQILGWMEMQNLLKSNDK